MRWALRVPCKLWQRGSVGCCPCRPVSGLGIREQGNGGADARQAWKQGLACRMPGDSSQPWSWLPGSERGSAGSGSPFPRAPDAAGTPHPRTSADCCPPVRVHFPSWLLRSGCQRGAFKGGSEEPRGCRGWGQGRVYLEATLVKPQSPLPHRPFRGREEPACFHRSVHV